MKMSTSLLASRLAALFMLGTGLALTTAASAADHPGHEKSPSTEKSSADAQAAYPLTTCVVSGEKLGSADMGPPIDYIHKESGKPDRLVRFCCKGCIRDFKKDPAKYLKMIDDAAAGKTKVEHGAHH
jgi:hypothetical protein